MSGMWHLAFAVPDLKEGMEEFSKILQLTWREPYEARVMIEDEAGNQEDRTVMAVFVEGGPFGLELFEQTGGEKFGFDHLGYWTENWEEEHERLQKEGIEVHTGRSVTSGRHFLLSMGAHGMQYEALDVRDDRPVVRDFYPKDSPHYGEPLSHE